MNDNVLSLDELKAYCAYFVCNDELLKSPPPYDWNFIIWSWAACGMPSDFMNPNDPIVPIVQRVLAFKPKGVGEHISGIDDDEVV